MLFFYSGGLYINWAYSNNPLEIPEIIAIIVKKLTLEVLDKFRWINSTWYKEIQYEHRRRRKIQVPDYDKLEQEEELEMIEAARNILSIYTC